jgi:1-acyl-sn-glycerol-3-phosphate acyltransferase
MLARCEETLRAGSSIMMFPEGTRSKDGRLQAFKPGAFDLAIRLGLPVLPVVVTGTADALPKHGFVLQGRHPIGIRVLDPIGPETYAGVDAASLAARVRGVYAVELGEPAGPDPG